MSQNQKRIETRDLLESFNSSDLRFLCGMLKQRRGGAKEELVDNILSSGYPLGELRQLALELCLGFEAERFVQRSVWAEVLSSNGLPSSGSRHMMLLTLVENRLFDPRKTMESLKREQLNDIYYEIYGRISTGETTRAIDDLLSAFDLDRDIDQRGAHRMEKSATPLRPESTVEESRQSKNPDTFGGRELVRTDVEPKPLRIRLDGQLSIFISCGSDPAERESGSWLYETLLRTPLVTPFLWEQKSPGASPSRSLQERLLQKARDSDGVIGFLHYRGSKQGQSFSLACYDEISTAATSGVPTLVFRTPSVGIDGMVLPQQEVRTINRISETLPYLRSWMTSIHPKGPLSTIQMFIVRVKRTLGKPRTAIELCLLAELINPREPTTLHVRPFYYKPKALSPKFMKMLAQDHRVGESTIHSIELIGITEAALSEIRQLRVPFFKESDMG